MKGSLYASFSPSATASRSPYVDTCAGWKPATWQSCDKSYWPSTCNRNTKFGAIFSNAGSYTDQKLGDLLGLQTSFGPDCMVKHLVAALLNARTNKVPDLVAGESIVKEVWREYSTIGYYEPTAGVRWNCDAAANGSGGITPWLKSTMVA